MIEGVRLLLILAYILNVIKHLLALFNIYLLKISGKSTVEQWEVFKKTFINDWTLLAFMSALYLICS